jgi:phosphomannomutase
VVIKSTQRADRLQKVKPEMLQLLSELRHKVVIGYVGGSDLTKQQEQLGTAEVPVTSLFDFCFPENGLAAYRMGEKLQGTSFIEWIGEEKYKELVKWYALSGPQVIRLCLIERDNCR